MAESSENRKRKSKVGATRSPVKPSRRFSFPLKEIAFVVFTVGLIFGVSQIEFDKHYNAIVAVISKPVTNITVEGEFSLASKAVIEQLVRDEINGDFVNLNLQNIKQSIEADPWVESVNAKRVWPDALVLTLSEQRPVARWGSEGFINQSGELINVDLNGKLDNYPLLYGNKNNREIIARWYINSQKFLSSYGFNIRSIEVNEKDDWLLEINHGIKVYLGGESKQEKMEQFLQVYHQELSDRLEEIESIDLRYKQALAVTWKNIDNNMVAAND